MASLARQKEKRLARVLFRTGPGDRNNMISLSTDGVVDLLMFSHVYACTYVVYTTYDGAASKRLRYLYVLCTHVKEAEFVCW